MNIKNLRFLLGVGVALSATLFVFSLAAAPTWAAGFEDLAKDATTNGWRAGRGASLCPIKLAILVVVYLSWVASTSWANNDAERLGDPDRGFWNGMNLISFAVGALAALFIPIFWVGLPVAILSWLVPAFIYVKARNKDLLDADKVMTPGHLVFWFRTRVLKQKVKPKPLTYEGGSAIQLEATEKGVDEQTLIGRTFRSRSLGDSVGYNNFRELLYHAIHARATELTIEFGSEETKFQYQIDGVYHPILDAFKKPWLRELADQVAESAKYLVGAKPQDRRGRQRGTFVVKYDKNKKGKPFVCDAELETVGTQTGEMFRVVFKLKAAPFRSLEELGVSPDRQEIIRKLVNSDKGLVILAAGPHQGLKTLTTVAFNTADRFTRDFSTVEDAQMPYETIENIRLYQYDSAKGETPITILSDVFFQEPKVLLIRDMVDVASWTLCCEEVKNDRLIITTCRGKDSIAALVSLLQFGVDPKALADSLEGFVAQKLVRRLCPDCKEEIKPSPQILKNLGLDPKIEKIWRKRVHQPVEQGQRDYYVPCDECRDIGYKGRVAIFDVLLFNDEMRQILVAKADLAAKERALRNAAFKSGQRGYLVDGARLVQEGVISFEELVRVMK